jgi:hypothetical protein
MEIIRLLVPADVPVKARIGVLGWRDDRPDPYGAPEIKLLRGQEEIPVPPKNTPKEVSLNNSDQISFNLGRMIDSYDALAADYRKKDDELKQQRITSRAAVLAPSESTQVTKPE